LLKRRESSSSGNSDRLFRTAESRWRLLSESLGKPLSKAALRKLYLRVRQLKRRLLLTDPAIDFTEILCIDQPYPRFPDNGPGKRGTKSGRICRHENAHRNGPMATAGGRLLRLGGLSPSAPLTELGPALPGSYWRADLSFDADRVLFCYKAEQEKTFHLYETSIKGGKIRQLTFGPYDDLDPIYLPDGHLMFVTTRCHTYVRCMPHANAYVLARCDSDGSRIQILSRSNECDWLPTLLDDGRVLYSRWEYTDKPLWRIQSLWTVNPDGTGVAAMWGNQSVWPDHLAQARPIPGTDAFMFCGSGHHDWFAGCLGIVRPQRGRDFPHGLTKVTSHLSWPESGDGPVDYEENNATWEQGNFTAFQTPFPLDDFLFLASARRGNDEKFRLYLMTLEGDTELLFEGDHNLWHAMPIRKRKPPFRRPEMEELAESGTSDRADSKEGILYSVDLFEGTAPRLRQHAKYLRVMEQVHTTFSEGEQTFRWSGPCLSIVQEDGAKRVLGTVPIAEDGSVCMQVPAGRMLFFQLLDRHHRALQTMRSFTGVMPGEVRGCLGCHERHGRAPNHSVRHTLALEPSTPIPPPWGKETIGYERFVQPVLDRYCGDCHQGDGEARDVLDLTLRPGYRHMSEPYLTLVGPAIWKNPRLADMPLPDAESPGYGLAGIYPVEAFPPEAIVAPFKWYNSPNVFPAAHDAKYATLPPMTWLSYRSPLIELCRSGEHYQTRVDPKSLRRLIVWVDAMAPYWGMEEVRSIPDPEFEGIDQLPLRPRMTTAPVVSRP
jgi:hypothetical protein